MVTDLRLQHFRSYKDAAFEMGPGVNIIVGPNASGKTNLLEAVLVLARGGSYRAKDAEIIMFNKEWGRLDADLRPDRPGMAADRVRADRREGVAKGAHHHHHHLGRVAEG